MLEVVVGTAEDAGQIGDPRPDRVLARVPALLRLVKALVVGVLGLVDALLEAHVLGHPVPERQQLVRGHQPGEPPIAIGHGVDGQDVEDQRAEED